MVTSAGKVIFLMRAASPIALSKQADQPKQGQRENARTVLQPVFDQFVAGFGTAHLKSAARPLETLSWSSDGYAKRAARQRAMPVAPAGTS
jgi:hypothetical protein